MTQYVVARRDLAILDQTYPVGTLLSESTVAALPRPESLLRAGLIKEVVDDDAKPGGAGPGTGPKRRRRRQSQSVEGTPPAQRQG